MWLLLAKMKWFICDVIPDSHLIGGRRNMTIKWNDSSVMWYVYIIDEKGERFNPIHTTQLHLLSKWSDSSVMSFLYIGVSLMRKVRYLFLLQEGSPIWRGYSPNGTAVSKIKWFICDVITDSHLIAGRWNRTINPRKLIYRWKWSDSSVMWYIYIADEKGEKFNLVPGRITYLMEVFTKRDCC